MALGRGGTRGRGVSATVDSVVVLDGIALVRGSIMAFNNPARQAMMIQLVGPRRTAETRSH